MSKRISDLRCAGAPLLGLEGHSLLHRCAQLGLISILHAFLRAYLGRAESLLNNVDKA